GIYSVAYRPHAPLVFLPRSVLAATFPAFTRMAADAATLGRAFAQSIRLLWIAGLPIAVAISLYAEPLITTLAGREYLEAVPLMRILIWKTALAFLSTQFRFLFAAVGKLQTYARLVLVVFLLEAVVEMALIPWWGCLGACTGSVLGELGFTAA